MSRVLFCDIETTGLDPSKDRILEVYGRVFDLDTLESGPEFYWLVGNSMYANVDPYVQEMHTKNGLWKAIENNNYHSFLGEKMTVFFTENMTEEFIAKKVVLAGRSVHFDLKFLKTYLTGFHHRVFDLRSIIEFWVANTADKNLETRFKTSTELVEHRAKADVINDILLYQEISYRIREVEFYLPNT